VQKKNQQPVRVISPDAYPRLVPKAAAALLARMIKSDETTKKAMRIIAMKAESLRAAVLDYVDRLCDAGKDHDFTAIYEQAHEIRGLAETAGLRATGRIADGLCQYLDAVTRAGADADPSVVHLHLGAILRAAKAGSDSQLGDVVTGELRALVERKLAEIAP
jgi:chemotaxis protein histidine kinase CheA